MKTKREVKEKFWKQHVENYYQSGLSKKTYCSENKISYWSFNDWKKRLEHTNQSRKLTEIPQNIISIVPRSFDRFEITFQDNISISIPDNFEPEVLLKIIKTLRSITC